MSGFHVVPRNGYLERVRCICGYFMRFKDATICFLTKEPDFSMLPRQDHNWMYSVYGEVKELIPMDIPEPLGNFVTTVTYGDTNLFHDLITGKSVIGILHLLNQTPIDYFSKKQSMVDTATYGSKYVMARTAVEQIIDLCLTLRYLCIPLCEVSYLFGDNKSVVDSSVIPHFQLHKQHMALSFHQVCETISSSML